MPLRRVVVLVAASVAMAAVSGACASDAVLPPSQPPNAQPGPEVIATDGPLPFGAAGLAANRGGFAMPEPNRRRSANQRPPASGVFSAITRRTTDGSLLDAEPLAARLVSEASAGSFSAVKGLLDEGADPGSISGAQRSALVEAVRYDHPRIVRLLLERGADPNRAASRGHSALTVAVRLDRRDAVDLLLRAGALPGQPDPAGPSPLDWARELGREELLARLKTRSPVRTSAANPLRYSEGISVGPLDRPER